MKITEVTISRAKKVNLGNYESAEDFCAFKATVETMDSAKDIADTLFRLADTALKENGHKDLEQRAKEKLKK
jgi:hypothetical protein